MKKTLALFFVLSLFALGCQGATVDETIDQMPAQVTVETETSTVKHYTDGHGFSFDYPGDVLIFRSVVGEGGYSEELTFLEEEEDGVYGYAGPMITIRDWGEVGTAEEQYAKDQKDVGEAAEPVTLSTAEAFEVPVVDDFGGQNYTLLEFLFENSRYTPSDSSPQQYLYGVISRPFAASNERYQEILDLFEQTVVFN